MTSTMSPCETDRSAVWGRKDDAEPAASLAIWVRQPWMVRVGRENLLIRGTTPRDLTALAAMHSRCSAAALLDRYRLGGRAPSAVALEQLLRRTLAFVACTARGEIVAMAVAAPDPTHEEGAAEVGLLVQDDWQRRGLGRELLTHLSGGAYVCGYNQLISYISESVTAAQHLMTVIGRTYFVPDPEVPHLHTYLTESSALGLGAVREHLAS
jgi:GNAT superfamily N-acetyltransferase